ncbi:MAG TPA: septal ring lytic transglycosylase RlpA family protein [Zeimonas sp.]
MRLVRVAAWAAVVPLLFALGACSTSKGVRGPSTGADDSIAGRKASGGGYYLDDGPGHLSPADVAAIPDAVPRAEPVLARTARPYTVFGRTYTPMNALVPYRERGMASWYGRRYHGKPTSSGEPYDMYAMTAAHPTLPIPSYVRVTRVSNGRSVVVRVNDRGPFLQNRLIDLSYTAAAKLGFVEAGSAEVEVEAITRFDAPVLVARSQSADAPMAQAVRAEPADGTRARAVRAAPADAPPSAPIGAPPSGAIVSTVATPAPEAAPSRLVVETSFADSAAPLGGSPTSAEASASPPATPEPVSATPMAAAPLPAPPGQGENSPGFWLQFGAFASADSARSALERFRRELSWLGARFQLRVEGALYKVQAGPWPARDHALEAAGRIRRATVFEPFAVYR